MRVFYDWRQISFALKTFADFSNASVVECTVRKTADALLTQSTTQTIIFVKKYQLFTYAINIKHQKLKHLFSDVFSFSSAEKHDLNCD